MKHKSNEQTFREAYNIALIKIEKFFMRRLADFGKILLNDARDGKKGWNSFTGNTITSLAFGLYEHNSLTDIVFVSGVKPPVHAKIRNGETVYLEDPYEGEARSVTGKVDIYNDWGNETSVRTLQELRPKGDSGIIVTTGTEYSEFLEKKGDFNVLSDTELYARMNALQWMRSKINKNVAIDSL